MSTRETLADSGSTPEAAARRPGDLALMIVVFTLFTVYCLAFIFSTSFVVGGERYFCLFDDAMISMRYAANLAAGDGLLFNPGQAPVEGITNLLWTLLMSLAHLLPLAASKISLVVQLLSLVCLAANLLVVRRLVIEAGGGKIASAAGMLLVGFYFPLNNWSLQGMEVGLLTLLVTSSALFLLRWRATGRGAARPWLLLGIAMLVRMDAAVLVVAAAAWSFFAVPSRRRTALAYSTATLFVCLGGLTVFRLLYFDAWLPNTYHLKMTGFPLLARLYNGLGAYIDFALGLNPLLFLAPAVLLVFAGNHKLWLLGALFAAQSLYSVWVGGDAWEPWGGANRFVCVVMPAFFILLALGTEKCLRQLGKAVTRPAGFWRSLLVGLILLGLVLETNRTGRVNSLQAWAQLKRPMHNLAHRWMVERARLIRELTSARASVAVAWSGILPYFVDRTIVDLLGKNDRVVARSRAYVPPGSDPLDSFYPGHQKWDYSRSIGELDPDVIVQLWTLPDPSGAMWLADIPPDAVPWLDEKYVAALYNDATLLLRRKSPEISWKRAKAQAGRHNVIRAANFAGAGRQRAGLSRPADKKNLILIVIDALRPDHLTCYGRQRKDTPVLDGLAAQSIVYERAYAQSSWTKTSVASLLTGLYPQRHGVRTELGPRSILPEEANSLAEQLGSQGYRTAAVSANPHITPDFGFAQGFETFSYRSTWAANSTEKVEEAVVKMLDEQLKQEPFFLFVHFLDPHDPYRPLNGCERELPKKTVNDENVLSGRAFVLSGEMALGKKLQAGQIPRPRDLSPEELSYLRGLYDCEIRAVDSAIGNVMEALEKKGLQERTVIVITSDHGEEFLEHGMLRHGYQLYEESVRVPLLLSLPAGEKRSLRVAAAVQLVDLFPTLCELLGMDIDSDVERLDGTVMPPFKETGTSAAGHPVFGATMFRNQDRAYLLRDRQKVIADLKNGKREFYDLSTDPGEQRPVDPLSSAAGRELSKMLDGIVERARSRGLGRDDAAIDVDEEVEEQLRSLGYVE